METTHSNNKTKPLTKRELNRARFLLFLASLQNQKWDMPKIKQPKNEECVLPIWWDLRKEDFINISSS